jgi:hypothetical protein
VADGLHEQAAFGFAGDHRWPGITALEDGLARVEAQSALALAGLGAVAAIAPLDQ